MTGTGEPVRKVRVVLPYHLRNLACVGNEIEMEITGPVSVRSVVDAVEARYPMLVGTIRDHVTKQRRPFLRFFACEEDLSHDSMDKDLPQEVAEGKEPLLIVGAIAGGEDPTLAAINVAPKVGHPAKMQVLRLRSPTATSAQDDNT